MFAINAVKAKLKAGQEVFGILNSVPSPLICEMLGYAGYDFVVLDTEHLLVTQKDLEHGIRACECAGITPFVRVPKDDRSMIQRVLDMGAQGIVIPQVNTLIQAQESVSAVRFAPLGHRGITGGRNTGFGSMDLNDYMALANSEVMLVLMIESTEGVAVLPEMLDLQGVDMVLEGALDLSIDMGHGSDVQHKFVQSALNTIAQHCAKAEVPFCAIPRQYGQLNAWRNAGVRAFLTGEDRGILFRALRSHLNSFQSED